MRIANRYKKAKEMLLENFLNALGGERKESVVLAIGFATQYVLEKDFGIVEVTEGEFNSSMDMETLRKELKQALATVVK
jgi:hypothetical protein